MLYIVVVDPKNVTLSILLNKKCHPIDQLFSQFCDTIFCIKTARFQDFQDFILETAQVPHVWETSAIHFFHIYLQ